VLLVGVGVVLALVAFVSVLTMPDLVYHPARDAELRATYATYQETGTLLVKHSGTGSWYGAVPGGGLTRAAGDDDPGTYLVASLMSHVTGSASPYPGLRWAMALLSALPLLLLPLTVARLFGRVRAGVALLGLPVVTWLVNKGTILVGTEYGLADLTSPTRVYALYGMAAAMVFLSLVVTTHLTTHRLRPWQLVAASAVLVAMASLCSLMRSLSGIGVAVAVGVLWWSAWRGRARWLVSAGAALVAVVGTLLVPGVVMGRIDHGRQEVISAEAAALPDTHGTWHPLYLGLSYPQPITGAASPFGIQWSDEFGWAKAREVDPDVLVASSEYDAIMKDLYLDQLRERPWTAARLYAGKLLFTVKQFGAMLLLIVCGLGLALRRVGRHRRRVAVAGAVAAPTLAWGLLPPVLVMPLLYYYSELVAALGLLSAIALGGLVLAYTTLPSMVRVADRRNRSARVPQPTDPVEARALSVVVPTRNGAAVLPETLETLGRRLRSDDEIIVVENGSTDHTYAAALEIRSSWRHAPALVVLRSPAGLGNAYRTGVLASSGSRVLLTADDLPFGTSDLVAFDSLPEDIVLAIGSKAHPASVVSRSWRRTVQSQVFRRLREALLQSAVGDSQGTMWVSGPWARAFAMVSRETGLMWTVELVLAAEQQGLDVYEVPVTLVPRHDEASSRFRLRDALVAVREIANLAAYKDDYRAADVATPGRVIAAAADDRDADRAYAGSAARGRATPGHTEEREP
jgi:hypothetical protein